MTDHPDIDRPYPEAARAAKDRLIIEANGARRNGIKHAAADPADIYEVAKHYEMLEEGLKRIMFLRPGGPTRSKVVEQMENIARDALAGRLT